jgi:sugar lactone lactonase YvrE
MLQGLNMNSNPVTGLPAPTNASDAATRQFVLDNAAPVSSVNTKTGAVVLSAGDIAITDTSGNFTIDTVQGAIDQLFTSANNGKTSIASAIGSPAVATNTFSELSNHITTGKGQIATATGDATVNSTSTFQQLSDAVSLLANPTYGVEKTVLYDETIAKGDVVESNYKSMSLTRLSQMPTGVQPDANANAIAWSADGKLLAVGHNSPNFLSIFNYDEATHTFNNFLDPVTLPTSQANGIAFSNNGDFLAVAHNSSPQVTIYKRNANAFVKLANPATLPGGSNGRAVAFSADSNYMSVASSGTVQLTVYFRSGELFTKIADSGEVYGSAFATAWRPDSRYVLIGYGVAPFFKVLKLNGNGTTTTMSRIASTEAVEGQVNGAAWSPDGTYLALAHSGTTLVNGTSRLAIYKQSGDTLTRLTISNPITTSVSALGTTWSQCGRYLFVSLAGSPNFIIYKRTGDSFELLSTPTTPYGTVVNAVAVHPNNNIISVAHDSNTFVTHYQNYGSYLFSKANTDVINPSDKIIGIAKEAGISNDTKTVDVLVGGSLLP